MQRLRSRCQSLDRFPERGKPYGAHHRCMIEGRYLIFYRIVASDPDPLVVIMAILHGARDLPALPGLDGDPD